MKGYKKKCDRPIEILTCLLTEQSDLKRSSTSKIYRNVVYREYRVILALILAERTCEFKCMWYITTLIIV